MSGCGHSPDIQWTPVAYKESNKSAGWSGPSAKRTVFSSNNLPTTYILKKTQNKRNKRKSILARSHKNLWIGLLLFCQNNMNVLFVIQAPRYPCPLPYRVLTCPLVFSCLYNHFIITTTDRGGTCKCKSKNKSGSSPNSLPSRPRNLPGVCGTYLSKNREKFRFPMKQMPELSFLSAIVSNPALLAICFTSLKSYGVCVNRRILKCWPVAF